MKDKITDAILKFSAYLQGQKYMMVIKNSFVKMLFVIIIGSFCTLFTSVISSTSKGAFSLANIPGMSWLSSFSKIFNAINYSTMNMLALIAVLFIAVEMANYHKIENKFMNVIISLSCYICLCSTEVTTLVDGKETVVKNVLNSSYTGVQGLFLAMISTIIASEIYIKLLNSNKFEIKMPESVPANVAQSFNVLIPGFLTLIIISFFSFTFNSIFGITVFEAVSIFIQEPLRGLLTGLPGYLFIIFMTTFLWFFGIHGTQVLKPVYSVGLLVALAENTEAVANGNPAPNILNEAFRSSFSTVTGAGITGGLIVAILLFSKREDWRAIAKLGLPCAIFNINEPVLFGLPIVLNPILGLPFMLTPAVTATFAYFMTKIGFAVPMSVYAPWTTPPLISAFLNTQGHWGTVIVQALCLIISFLIYTPFVIIGNKVKNTEESM